MVTELRALENQLWLEICRWPLRARPLRGWRAVVHQVPLGARRMGGLLSTSIRALGKEFSLR
eukprot:6194336-Amphidinium_carterae.1